MIVLRYMAGPPDQEPPKPLNYAAPAPVSREGLSRPIEIALATIFFTVGIPLCAVGVVSGLNDRDVGPWLGLMAVGGMFCFAGMRLTRRPLDPGK